MEQISFLSPTEPRIVKSCAFTGHRHLRDDCSFIKIEEALRSLIERGVDTFYNGMAMGFDLLCAECILSLKKEFPEIRLICCLPCPNQDRYYSKIDKERFSKILNEADDKILLSEGYYNGCMLTRNRYMADLADVLVTYHREKTGGTAYTVQYFRKNFPGRELILL